MNPLEVKVKELENKIELMRQGLDAEFIEAIKALAVGNTLSIENANASAGPLNTVADSVDVARDYDFQLIVKDAQGNSYKLGRYT